MTKERWRVKNDPNLRDVIYGRPLRGSSKPHQNGPCYRKFLLQFYSLLLVTIYGLELQWLMIKENVIHIDPLEFVSYLNYWNIVNKIN